MYRRRAAVAAFALALGLSALLAACAGGRYAAERASYPQLPAGSRIELLQRLEIPEGHARSFVQHGRAVAPQARDRRAVHCNFEVDAVRMPGDPAQFIEPDIFTVSGSRWRHEYGALPLRLAVGDDLPEWQMRSLFDGPNYSEHTVSLRLQSARQPQLRALHCTQRTAWPHSGRQPTRAQIAAALGAVARLIPAAE